MHIHANRRFFVRLYASMREHVIDTPAGRLGIKTDRWGLVCCLYFLPYHPIVKAKPIYYVAH